MIEIKTKTEVHTTHLINTELTLEELKSIQTALYETDKEGNLLNKIGNVVRDAQNAITDLDRASERNVTQDQVIAAQGGACTTGNCD